MYLKLKILLSSANILTCREKEKKKTITPSTLCTSTPNTTQNVQEKCEISGILPNNNTLVAVQEENDKTLVKTDTVDNVIKMDVINEIQTIELKADENEIEEVEMKIEDDKVDEIQPVDENEGIVKYKSPLDHIQNNRFVTANWYIFYYILLFFNLNSIC